MPEPLRLLLIEDNPGDARLLIETLRDEVAEGFVWATVETLGAGLARLQAEPFDAVLLDLSLPDSHGLDSFNRLHRAWPNVPCVVLTGLADQTLALHAVQQGAQDFLVKGETSGGLLVRSIRYAIERQKNSHFVALMMERERFDTAVSQMSDGIVVTDGQWRLTSANRAAQLLLNLPPDAGRQLLPAVLGRFRLSLPLAAVATTCEKLTAFEMVREQTRPPLYLDARLTRLMDPAGRMISAVLTLRDVTDERRDRLAQVSFLSLMSHKLRTPLTILQGYLDIIQNIPNERWNDETRQMVAICRRELGGLTDRIRRLLDVKQFEPGSPALNSNGNGTGEREVRHQTDLQAVIEEAARAMLERHGDRPLEVTTACHGAMAAVDAPAEHCRFVVEQLLDNAAKFGDKPLTTITVEAAQGEGGELRVTIQDNGPGIPHEYYDRIFDGFVQLEENGTGEIPGLGVGLRLARNVVAAHGGQLEVRSTIGQGTTVSFTLPAAL